VMRGVDFAPMLRLIVCRVRAHVRGSFRAGL
jgi:hypothetical protein